MGWDIDIREKVYHRLANEIFFRILHGEYELGAKLPSYLDLAKEAGSNTETVRKAIRELEESKIVKKTRKGYFVTDDLAEISDFRQHYLITITRAYLEAKKKVENVMIPNLLL